MAGADILLVDDDPNIRKLMRVYLEREHFQIHKPATDKRHGTYCKPKRWIWLSSMS
jgi:DNA-binding response OmpR family regulator